MLDGFHDVLFPLAVSYGARGGPVWRTDIVGLANGHERRVGGWAAPRRRYDAGFGLRSAADIKAVLAFFDARGGRRHSFRWRDPLDHSSSSDGDPQATDQPQGSGDGTSTVFPLSLTREGVERRIHLPVEGSVLVAIDGAEQPTTVYSVTEGSIVFDAAPPAGASVTAGFLFDVPVRFDTDSLQIGVEPGGGSLPTIPIVEVLS